MPDPVKPEEEPNPSKEAESASNISASGPPSVATVAIKLPPFWTPDPELWFSQVEAQFRTRRIKDEQTKFDYVIGALTPEVAMEVRDLMVSPPADTPFTTLKKKLIGRVSISEERRLQMLLSEEQLGDRKPSQLVRRMRQLLGSTIIDDGILKSLFLKRLPSPVRVVVAAAPGTLEEVAELADRVSDIASPSINATISAPTSSATPTEHQLLIQQISELQQKVEKLSASGHGGRSRSRNRRTNHNRSRSNTPADSSLCWYHNEFGDKARKCSQPCKHWGNGNHQ